MEIKHFRADWDENKGKRYGVKAAVGMPVTAPANTSSLHAQTEKVR